MPSTVKIVYDTSGRSFGYSTPKVGWLVFRDDGHKSGVLRDGIGAWPDYKYSHYMMRRDKESKGHFASHLKNAGLWKRGSRFDH